MGAAQLTVRLGHVLGVDHTFHLASLRLGERVAAGTGGAVSVEIHPEGRLGSEEELYRLVREGRLDLALISTVNAREDFPRLDVLTLPYAFRSGEDTLAFLEADAGRELREAFRLATETSWLSFMTYGVRDIATTHRVVSTPDDLIGLRVRVPPNNPVFAATYEAFGAIPRPLVLHEVLPALEAGHLDATDIAPNALWRLGYHRVIRHMTLTGLFVGVAGFLASGRWWQTLPESVRSVIQSGAQDAAAYARIVEGAQTEEAMVVLEREGVVFHRPDPAPFRRRVERVWERVADTVGVVAVEAVRWVR